VCLPVGDVAADGDGVAAVAVLGDEDAVTTFLHGVFAGDLHGSVQVVSIVSGSWAVICRTRSEWRLFIVVSFSAGGVPGPRRAQASGAGRSRGGGKRWFQWGFPAFL
jgi:hypothetical protein